MMKLASVHVIANTLMNSLKNFLSEVNVGFVQYSVSHATLTSQEAGQMDAFKLKLRMFSDFRPAEMH